MEPGVVEVEKEGIYNYIHILMQKTDVLVYPS